MTIGSSWHSYPKSFNLGHSEVRDLLNFPHIIEEKVDGSQFSFGVFADDDVTPQQLIDGRPYDLRVRSKGAVMIVDAPEKMFTAAVATARELAPMLHVGWTYRAEYLAKPNHNTLRYDRIPAKNLIIFDVSTGDGEWLDAVAKRWEAGRLGLECVPVLLEDLKGGQTSYEDLRRIIDNTQSVLGGQLIEGVVIKPTVPLFGRDGRTLMGKFVSERFKESHVHAWRENNPTQTGILDRIIADHATEARWRKAIQHLRDAGQLQDAPQDIGKLLVEVEKDLGQEEKESIQKALWKWAWPHIARGVKAGFPEFYKNELLRRQFEQEEAVAVSMNPDVF